MMQKHMRVAGNYLIIIGLLLTQACTATVWKYALRKDYYLTGVEGISPANMEKPDFSGYLLVGYGNGTGNSTTFYERYYCAIPIVNGRVQDPFDYRGSQTDVKNILGDISPDQLNRIQSYCFDAESFNLGCKLYNEKKYIPNDRFHRPQFGSSYSNDTALGLIPYYTNTAEFADLKENSKIHWSPGKNPLQPPFDPACRIIFLPATQPVTKSECVGNVIDAIIKTPFTLAADIFVFPLICLFDSPKNAVADYRDQIIN